MEYPHGQPLAEEFGYSPGNGISAQLLSADPLATEEEALVEPVAVGGRDVDSDGTMIAADRRGRLPARREREPEPDPLVESERQLGALFGGGGNPLMADDRDRQGTLPIGPSPTQSRESRQDVERSEGGLLTDTRSGVGGGGADTEQETLVDGEEDEEFTLFDY